MKNPYDSSDPQMTDPLYDTLGKIANPLRQLPAHSPVSHIVDDVPSRNWLVHEFEAYANLCYLQKFPQALQNIVGDVTNFKILDLSCCTGLNSVYLMQRGAESVTGIDLLPMMINVARARTPKNLSVEYHVGNCMEPNLLSKLGLETGSYDLVFAPWVLNQASDGDALRGLFQNISSALKPGARLAGLAISGNLVLEFGPGKPFISESELSSYGGGYGTTWHAIRRVDDGYKMHLVNYREGCRPVQFECFILHPEIYDATAEAAGLPFTEWTWGSRIGVYTATKSYLHTDLNNEEYPDFTVRPVDDCDPDACPADD